MSFENFFQCQMQKEKNMADLFRLDELFCNFPVFFRPASLIRDMSVDIYHLGPVMRVVGIDFYPASGLEKSGFAKK